MRTLIPILACLLLVGGCEKKQEVTTEDVRIAYNQHAMEVFFDTLTPCPPCPDTVYAPDPYGIEIPCPDTVYKWVDPCDKTVALNPISRTVYRMPPGQWVKMDRWHVYKSFFPDSAYHHSGEFRFSDSSIFPCPDSVFILSRGE